MHSESSTFSEAFRNCVVQSPHLLEQMFDSLPDVLVYVKDVECRYLWVNEALVARSGLTSKEEVIGKTSDALFPVTGPGTITQDLEVIRTNRPSREHFRLYKTPSGERYWCLSSKFPLVGSSGRVTGLIGLSRDLPRPNERHRSYYRLAKFLDYLDRHLEHGVLISEAARHSAFSEDTLGRMVMDVFQVTPKQLLMKRRIDKACQLLEETEKSVAQVSAACGYNDHSAFTRQFRIATQVSPAQYRASLKPLVAGDTGLRSP